ncbi:unnamed protein product [Rotaria sp. Silwood2]|nr:unnamed protein product [Rotaria sp. Silwood2]CAF3217875.1 unnamed protein product [Rotaria sp. Silwood2]CAF4028209.1 unnamed protein product [Rotaria sp. Silwood2]CAF4161063.1 unnamed protein product [Rotaria sp. Silwood2]CAF4278299.1 unnamed protein product [Rotaria sp. Silwood2]
MTDDQWISIVNYLQPNGCFNYENFATIRDQYQQECGGSFPSLQNESALKKVAQKLKIKIDTNNNFELLCDCVLLSNADDSQSLVQSGLHGAIQPHNEVTLEKSNISSPKMFPLATMTNET